MLIGEKRIRGPDEGFEILTIEILVLCLYGLIF